VGLRKRKKAGKSRHEDEEYEPHSACIGGARFERY